tara:strand:- start:287 stop:1147 length:861 start_codon:yes stop_codon:yes gene_type:complete
MKINDLNIAFTVLISLFLAIDSYSQVLPSYHAVHHKKENSGSSSDNAAESCKEILDNYPSSSDGVYWINLPTVGATQCYCLMDSNYDGGGWTLAMKATQGTTFKYSANYWTTSNTLNESNVNRDDGDAKFEVMNHFLAKDMMAIFPDIENIGNESGSIDNLTTWSWLENDFYNNGSRITLLSILSGSTVTLSADPINEFDGFNSTYFTYQNGYKFYGFNRIYSNRSVRWGLIWNNESTINTGDCAGGIGLHSKWSNYSAGDKRTWNRIPVNQRGINRSARVEIYVR